MARRMDEEDVNLAGRLTTRISLRRKILIAVCNYTSVPTDAPLNQLVYPSAPHSTGAR